MENVEIRKENLQALESRVMNASPFELRLMLIEGAIRFAREAHDAWKRNENNIGMKSIVNCRDVVTELLQRILPDGSALSRQIASIYVFLSQHLIEIQLRRDQKKLDEVIRVLEVERETWHRFVTISPPRHFLRQHQAR